MTNDVRIQVPVTCDRTGNKYLITMSKESLNRYMVNAKQKHLAAEKISDFLNNLPTPHPDLVVFYKGKLVILETIVGKTDKGIIRFDAFS
jgi:hypothetical protein